MGYRSTPNRHSRLGRDNNAMDYQSIRTMPNQRVQGYGFKRFSVAVFTRTVMLCVSVFLLIYLLTKTSFVATPFIVALLIIGQVYYLVQYVQKTNREIARFSIP